MQPEPGRPDRVRCVDVLAPEGLDAEVLDLRTLRPLDTGTIIESVARTHRAVIVHEAQRSCGLAAEIAARINEKALLDLEAPVERVTGANAPMPYARNLERSKVPSRERIMEAVRRVCDANGGS